MGLYKIIGRGIIKNVLELCKNYWIQVEGMCRKCAWSLFVIFICNVLVVLHLCFSGVTFVFSLIVMPTVDQVEHL